MNEIINPKINTESYVDRSARRANRAAWKQSQCVASGQGQPGSQYHSLARSNSAFSHSQHSSVSISSGSVSSIASSLTASGTAGKLFKSINK